MDVEATRLGNSWILLQPGLSFVVHHLQKTSPTHGTVPFTIAVKFYALAGITPVERCAVKPRGLVGHIIMQSCGRASAHMLISLVDSPGGSKGSHNLQHASFEPKSMMNHIL